MFPKLRFCIRFGGSCLIRRSESASVLLRVILQHFQAPGFGRGCRVVSSPGRLYPHVPPSVSAMAFPAALVVSRKEGQRLSGSDGQMLSQPPHGLWVRAAHKHSATSPVVPGVCGWTSPAQCLARDGSWGVSRDLKRKVQASSRFPVPYSPSRQAGRQGRDGQHPPPCEYK